MGRGDLPLNFPGICGFHCFSRCWERPGRAPLGKGRPFPLKWGGGGLRGRSRGPWRPPTEFSWYLRFSLFFPLLGEAWPGAPREGSPFSTLSGVANSPPENTEGQVKKLPAAGAVADGRCVGGAMVGVGQVCHNIVLGARRGAACVHRGERGARPADFGFRIY